MGKTSDLHDRYLVPSLARGIQVLGCFTATIPRLTQAEIASSLGITRSAVFRVVYTLTELGFLLHDPASGCYTLGPALLRLGHGILPARDVVQVAIPVLEALQDATGWSAHLGVLERQEVVYLLRVPARQGRSSIVHVGSRLPAHATAMGRVLLAAADTTALHALYRDTLPKGITLPQIMRQARADRARGLVAHRGEFEAGIASVAAPLRDAAGRVVAAINLSAPVAEAPEAQHRAVRDAVLQAAATISASLGWTDESNRTGRR